MALPLLMIAIGLVILVWSADLFVEGAASAARHLGMSSLLIGMLVIGFGTSAPELSVSAMSALQGNPGIALGNAYGSNITNIALILGLVAFIQPITVKSGIIRKELPLLVIVTLAVLQQIYDGHFSRFDALIELIMFAAVMIWIMKQDVQPNSDPLVHEIEDELEEHAMSFAQSFIWLIAGLVLLVISSKMLVWGAVTVARDLGVSDLIIGLTIVAIGTSLPELASSIAAARKGENDLALGNIIGSNLFNTLAVVGLAGAIHPMDIPQDIIHRDWPMVVLLTLGLFAISYRPNGDDGEITRIKGAGLLAVFIGYTTYLIHHTMSLPT